MKTMVEVTVDDLARALQALAHDVADAVETGYFRPWQAVGEAGGSERATAADRSREGSHDSAGR
jgi:hypothetical protein